jgi:hypothetical protein
MSGTNRRAPKRKAALAALVAIQKIKVTEEEADDVFLLDAKAPSAGGGRQVHFCIGGVALPEELACHILGFCPKMELVHSISLVSTLWYDLSKSSVLWQTLDFLDLKQSKKNLASMGRFLKILQRPQFASLKYLGFPDIYRTLSRQIFPNISKACPLLEEIDCATVHGENNVGVRPFSDEMTKRPAIFPNSKKISLEMIHVDSNSLEQFVKAMDGRLVGLNLLAGRGRYQCLDTTLEAIGRYCPNLESFCNGFHGDSNEDHFEEIVTEKGIIALLQACPKLKVCMCGTVISYVTQHRTFFLHKNSRSYSFQNLELVNLKSIGKQAFHYILHSSNLSRLYVVGHSWPYSVLKDPVMLDNLSNKLDLKVVYPSPRHMH